eukprot:TRINITY_DN109199_c0_g1_i1.p1 TRINITY_DN109199_c0_g1~~TRINITY_DN109199_c0_g1_i1.p1  ORF type:complete len:421 (-),score=62.84 TRINITY_DN109199_c0_g1_i1:13-1275(-)
MALRALLWAGMGSVGVAGLFITGRHLGRRTRARRRIRELLQEHVGAEGRIVITGAGSGIGKELAEQFAQHPSVSLLLGCQNEERSEEGNIRIVPLELLEFDVVQRFAEEAHRFLAEGSEGLRLLINNAGVREPESSQTKFGVSRTWQTNFLSPFLLTEIIARKRENDRVHIPLCVVNVASGRENESKLNEVLLDTLTGRGSSSNEYADSKRALLLWTSVRAQSLAFKGNMFAHAVAPGKVDTRFGLYDFPAVLWPLTKPIRILMYRARAEGALSVAAAGLRKGAVSKFGQYLGEEQLLEDLVVWRMPDKQLAVQLVRWASMVTALEARCGGRPVSGLGKPLSITDLAVERPRQEDRWSSAERRWRFETYEEDDDEIAEAKESHLSSKLALSVHRMLIGCWERLPTFFPSQLLAEIGRAHV